MNVTTTSTVEPTHTSLAGRTWLVIYLLGITGQIAWAVENSWFNTFVFDMLTPDPRPIAWMVAASAITATLTTISMGTLSDRTRTRLGQRKPFILFGYVLWGVATIAFPMAAFIKMVGTAVVMVVVLDVIMTFFGSTANDAAFNAWATDISDPSNRGRVEGALNVCVLVANLIAIGAAGFIIDSLGYFVFFYALGGIVLVVGLVAGLLLREPEMPDDEQRPPYLNEVLSSFSWQTVKDNQQLFWLFLNIMIFSIAAQVVMPYLFIYIEHFLGYSKSELSMMGGVTLLVSAAAAIPIGLLADRYGRRVVLLGAVVGFSLASIFVSLARTTVPVVALFTLFMVGQTAWAIASGAWMRDLFPEDSRGRFYGLRMVFWIAIPMVVGPAIGSGLISAHGIPTTLNGEVGFIPPPIIWVVAGVIALLSLLPLLASRARQHAS